MARDPLSTFFARLRPPPDLGGDAASDAELLRRWADTRDPAAFELLVWRHGALVLGTCRRACRREADSEDAFQATFLMLAREAGRVRASLPGWLHRTANRAAMRASRRKPEMAMSTDLPAAARSGLDADELALLDAAVDGLGERHRRVVVLCYLQGHTAEDAANLLGVPRGTVLSRLASARQQLAASLTRRGVALPAALAIAPLSLDRVAACVEVMLNPRTAGPAAAIAHGVLAMIRLKAALAAATFAVAAVGAAVVGLTLTMLPAAGRPADPPPSVVPEDADRQVRRVALAAHDRAAAFDKLPRFDYQVRYRHGVVDSLRAVDATLDPLARGLTAPVRDQDWFGWYEIGFSWDEARCLWETRPGDTVLGRNSRFGTATDAWERSAARNGSSARFVRLPGVGRLWGSVNHFDFSYLRLTPHRYRWGRTVGERQDTVSLLPPDRVAWRPLGAEPFGGEECEVVDSAERGQRLWVGRASGHVRGALTYYLRDPDRAAKAPPFHAADEVRRIAGRAFATAREYADWREASADDDQKVRLSLAWHALHPPGPKAVVDPSDLVRFDDYREVAPGVWVPFAETRTFFHSSETKGKSLVRRSELRVTAVRTDRDLAGEIARLMPKEGDPVLDRRFAAAVDTKFDPGRADADIQKEADAKVAKRLKDADLANPSTEPARAPRNPPADAPAAEVHRLVDRLESLRSKAGEDEWAAALRDLVRVGPPATPALAAEIDRTTDEFTLRCLFFAARGIGDKRAVPALIRAIPRTLAKGGSDMGYIAKNPELLAFMQKHDSGGTKGGTHYDFGRARTESRAALRALTGARHGEEELNFVSLGGSPRQQHLQRQQFQRCAERWAGWWEAHWKEFVADEKYARVGLAPLAGGPPAGGTGFPRGPGVTLGGWRTNGVLQSSRDQGAKFVFLDLDTGREAALPERLRAAPGQPERVDEIAAWAAAEGFDLMGTEYAAPGDGPPRYVLRGLGLAAWRLDGDRRKSLEADLRGDGPLPAGPQAEGLLLRFDAGMGRYDPADAATYLFRTREGGHGAIFVGVEVRDDTLRAGGGMPANIELSPVAFHKGRRYAYSFITEGPKEKAPAR